MKKIVLALSFSLFMIMMTGCSSSKPNFEDSLQKNFEKGKELFEKEKYYPAIDKFTFVVFNSPGSEIADDAQLYLGNCHFGLKEYIMAIDEYNRLINRWPASELVEQARYKIASAYYELSPKYQLFQQNTIEAIASYQDFILDYPQSEFRQESEDKIKELRSKLAKKIYGTGKLYMTLREWNAAIISYEEITEFYYDTDFIDETYLKISICYKNMNENDKSEEYFQMINPDGLETAQDKLLFNNLKN